MEPGTHGQIGIPATKHVEVAGRSEPESVTHHFMMETLVPDPQTIGKNAIPTLVQVRAIASLQTILNVGIYRQI